MQSTKSWHLEVVSAELADAVRTLSALDAVRNFYLAGGTGLALRLGHRRSVDLDFFSEGQFQEDALIAAMQTLSGLTILSKSSQTVYLQVHGIKASFIWYGYPLLFPFEYLQGLAVADSRDIACMKISALAGRGSRRDFVDLYVAAQQYGLRHLLDLFRQKFARANYSSIHVRKALTYFADAQKEPMPDMLVPLSWKEVTGYLLREVPRLPAT
jgi:hypothetical protein